MSFINCRIFGIGIDPAKYHNQSISRGDPNYPMSPSALREFMRCPSRWRRGYEPPESKSKEFGSLFDCRLLTPTQFESRYAIQPETYEAESKKKGEPSETKPWSNNANVCKAWNAEQRAAGREIVTAKELAECDAATARLMADPIIAGWHGQCDTQVQVEGMFQDQATGLFVPVRCLIDYVPRLDSEFASCLGDLKTSTSGSLAFFERQVYQMGYHIQAAFDLALFNAAAKEDRNTWCFIGLENYPPFEPFRRMLDSEFISLGRMAVDAGLRYYAQCLKRDEWPSYDDHSDAVQGWSVVAPSSWMEYEALSNKMAADVDAELTTEQKIDRAGL